MFQTKQQTKEAELSLPENKRLPENTFAGIFTAWHAAANIGNAADAAKKGRKEPFARPFVKS